MTGIFTFIYDLMTGIFTFIYDLLFGSDNSAWACGFNYCEHRRDPRCNGLNCTHHCGLYCRGTCFANPRNGSVDDDDDDLEEEFEDELEEDEEEEETK